MYVASPLFGMSSLPPPIDVNPSHEKFWTKPMPIGDGGGHVSLFGGAASGSIGSFNHDIDIKLTSGALRVRDPKILQFYNRLTDPAKCPEMARDRQIITKATPCPDAR